jgi:putative transposase
MSIRRQRVMERHLSMSKRSKANLLDVNLSSCYVTHQPISQDTVTLMNEIRDIYEKRPFQGYRRMTRDLKDSGYSVNHKRVYRLMRELGLQAVYPKKNLSKRRLKDQVYPYLLKQYPPRQPHDAWCVDITYLRLSNGFVYLTAIIDVVSRCIMGYHLSTSLETESCLNALEMAIKSGFKPKILNSDQGCQFTSQEWLYSLSLLQIQVSMDGQGRCLDNIPIERFWRTIKYEEVYLKTYDTVSEAREGVKNYIEWYNHKRRHSSLHQHRPYEVMMGHQKVKDYLFFGGDDYVDNADALTHRLTPLTTKTAFENNKQQKEKRVTHLSSKLAA